MLQRPLKTPSTRSHDTARIYRKEPMEYKHLGRSGLKVSRLALGTMNFGWVTDEGTAFSIMDQALDYGINLFDSADVYGGPQTPDMEQGYGTSEEIIGRWLEQRRTAGPDRAGHQAVPADGRRPQRPAPLRLPHP
jgi:hypothetical protein